MGVVTTPSRWLSTLSGHAASSLEAQIAELDELGDDLEVERRPCELRGRSRSLRGAALAVARRRHDVSTG
jgi:hypothetical protein